MSNEQKRTPDVTATTETLPAGISADSRTWAMSSHLSAFVMFLGIPAIVGPLVTWAIKKNDDTFVDYHGKEAVNFNLSFLIYGAASALLILAVVGLVLLPIVAVMWFALVIVASVKANAGEYYQYPFTIRFLH